MLTRLRAARTPCVSEPRSAQTRGRATEPAFMSRRSTIRRSPQDTGPPTRPVRRHAPPSYGYEDLLACGRGELFGPGNAQLPLPPMLMFDRITEIAETGGAYGKGHVRAELDVRPDLWFFACHFKGDPVMPGCLGLDALWQLVGFYLGWLGAAGPRPGARRRRGQVHRPGAAERDEGRLRRRPQARVPVEARARHRRRLARGRRRSASTRPRTCASACSSRSG